MPNIESNSLGNSPTLVGMNRYEHRMWKTLPEQPHARGDEPYAGSWGQDFGATPHARGDEPYVAVSNFGEPNNSPTLVGMNRSRS